MYALKIKTGLQAKTYATLDDAKRDAMGFLLSRSSERKVQVVELIVGMPFGGPQTPLWTLSRSKRGDAPKWKEEKAEQRTGD